jgi:DNA-binding PadR family transcriptional regulator
MTFRKFLYTKGLRGLMVAFQQEFYESRYVFSKKSGLSYSHGNDLLNALEKEKIIFVKFEGRWDRIQLTEKGKTLFENLSKINSILDDKN